MGYRRRRRSRRQSRTEGADKSFAIVLGLFALAVILLFAALWFFGG